MKQRALLLSCALVVAGCSPSQLKTRGPLQKAAGKAAHASWTSNRSPARRIQAPDAAFVSAGGNTVRLQQFAGQVVVLNLWASWCAPCVREMPSLNALAARASDLAVVAVSMDVQGPQVATEFFKRKGLNHLDAYHDPDGQLMRALGVYGLPVSVVIDRDGRVAATIQGEVDWNAAAVRDLLARAGA